MEPTELEINSFVIKFKQLLKSGFAAHIDIDTCNGKAWMGLRLQLGDAPVKQYRGNIESAKERRRSRRADEARNFKTQIIEKVVLWKLMMKLLVLST